MEVPRNTSDLISDWKKFQEFWQKKAVKQDRLQCFVLLAAVLLGFMLILGSLRQRTGRSKIQLILRAGYYLSGQFLSYVMGLLSDSPLHNGLVVIWAALLLILYGSTDSASTESIDDNKTRLDSLVWDYMLPSLWFFVILLYTVPPQRFWIPLLFLWVLFFLKLRERIVALRCACRSPDGLYRVTRVIAEFMKYEHREGNDNEEANPTTMQGFKYLVGYKEALQQVNSECPPRYDKHLDLSRIVTIENIWQCKGKLLDKNGDPDGHLKDTCLSFALFWLLLRRFSDYDLYELSSEDSRLKTWNFVRMGLIKEQKDGEECERAFRVIEVELDFVYDYFYNNFYAAYSRGGARHLLVRLVVVALYVVVSFVTLRKFNAEDGKSVAWYDTNNVAFHVTGAVILVLTVVELAQIAITITSKWVKVKLVCSYVQNRWWETRQGKFKESLLSMLCRAPCLRPWCKPWQRELRQYSLLDSYGHTPKILHFKCIFHGFMDLPTNGQKENKPTKLSMEVISAVIVYLRTNGKRLSNGVASLRRNHVEDRLISLVYHGNGTSTHVILVWHIATSICEKGSNNAENLGENFRVATSLSKYCAYMVALAPRLLPDHTYVTQCLFEEVVSEARKSLKDCDSKESMYRTLMILGGQSPGGTILEKGALLGKHFMEEIEDRWKVLAHFWTEMILFLAPSGDADVHAEYLVSGGEFITHLWALLTHAGIVDWDGVGDGGRDGDENGDGEVIGDADGNGDGEVAGDADGNGDGEVIGDADGNGDGEFIGDADGNEDEEGVGDTDGNGDGECIVDEQTLPRVRVHIFDLQTSQ